MKKQRLLQKVLSGTHNVRFSEVTALAKAFDFELDRVNGSHHIFIHPDIPELLNLQNMQGKAKPYQIKQMLQLIETHNLQLRNKS